MFVKKIIILKSDSGKNSGVLRLTATNGAIDGVLTLNFAVVSPHMLLLHTGRAHEVSVLESDTKFKISDEFSGDAHCMLIENETPILYGSSTNDQRMLSELKNAYLDQKQKEKNKKAGQPADGVKPDTNPAAQRQSNRAPSGDEGKNYARYQNSQSYGAQNQNPQYRAVKKNVSAQSNEPAAVINEGISYDGENFYIAVKPQLDEMFECYPAENRLNELIANSSWVKVDCENELYVVGIITDDKNKPEFICYGIPGTFPVKPPDEISDVCEWFPLSLENKFGDGFWLIYQDAKTGKCLRNE